MDDSYPSYEYAALTCSADVQLHLVPSALDLFLNPASAQTRHDAGLGAPAATSSGNARAIGPEPAAPLEAMFRCRPSLENPSYHWAAAASFGY